MNKKESSAKFHIPLAHYGYVTFTFDQRGHGEAERGKNDPGQLFRDSRVVLDIVCAASDVKEGAVCCIGTSLGGTTVLTKCYENPRVTMVIGMSALHSVEAFGKVKFNPFSIGKFFRWIMVKTAKRDKNPEVSPYYYLKSDPSFNKDRVYLIHGKKDPYFPPKMTFELNKQLAGVPEDHALLLENAAHGLDDQELLVLATFLKWLSKHEIMALK